MANFLHPQRCWIHIFHDKNSDELGITGRIPFFITNFELKQARLLKCGYIQGFYQQNKRLYLTIPYHFPLLLLMGILMRQKGPDYALFH